LTKHQKVLQRPFIVKIIYNTGKVINIAVQNVLKFLITSSVVEINIFMINIDVSLYVFKYYVNTLKM